MEHFVVVFSFIVSVVALAGAIFGYKATKKENCRILSSQLRIAADSWWENLSEAEQAEWRDKPGGVVVVDSYKAFMQSGNTQSGFEPMKLGN